MDRALRRHSSTSSCAACAQARIRTTAPSPSLSRTAFTSSSVRMNAAAQESKAPEDSTPVGSTTSAAWATGESHSSVTQTMGAPVAARRLLAPPCASDTGGSRRSRRRACVTLRGCPTSGRGCGSLLPRILFSVLMGLSDAHRHIPQLTHSCAARPHDAGARNSSLANFRVARRLQSEPGGFE